MAPLQGPASGGARRGGAAGSFCSEGRFVGRPGRRRPGVARATATTAGATTAGEATAATEATAALTTRGTGDLRGGVAEGRADLVDLELDDGALLAFLRVEGALL